MVTKKNWRLILCSGAEHLEEEFVRAGYSVITSNRNYDDSRKFANSDVYTRIPTVKKLQNRSVCVVQSFTCSGEGSKNNFTTGDRIVEVLQVLDILNHPTDVEYVDPTSRQYIQLNPPKEVVVLALHLPFSKQDQIYNTGESNVCQAMLRTLFSAGANRLVTIDPHVPLDFKWFHEYVESRKVIVLSMYKRVIDELVSREEFHQVRFVNTPGKKRSSIGSDLQEISKQRVSTTEVVLQGDLGEDFVGKLVFLIDDMVISGTTIKKARKLFLDRGAKSVHCWITHALPYEHGKEENLRRLVDAFDEKLFVSNTVRSQTFHRDFPYCYKSCVPLIVEEFLEKGGDKLDR
jgi:phosphoribosylpyrophosphate synthetase